MGFEIERKFIVQNKEVLKSFLDNQDSIQRTLINQSYLSINSNEEIRIRGSKDLSTGIRSYFLTIKSSGGLVRQENEVEISESTYLQLSSLLNFKSLYSIQKTRWSIPYRDFILEFDFFENQDLDLILLEIEFSSVEESNLFKVEDFFVPLREVTDQKKYKNRSIWLALNELK